MTECDIIKKYELLKKNVKPFDDEYFEGLNCEAIAGLVKKSIRITAHNKKLEKALEYIRKLLYQEFEKKLCPTICGNCSLGVIKMKIDEVIGVE